MKNADLPAMPLGECQNGLSQINPSAMGLTKREHFAAMAMQGLLASDVKAEMHQNDCAHIAVAHADALLDELEKSQ